MLAYRCLRLAGMAAAAAAILAAGPAAHHAAAPDHQARPVVAAGPYCPAGTNWNDILHACI